MTKFSPVEALARVQRSIRGRATRAGQRLLYRLLKERSSRDVLRAPWRRGKELISAGAPTPWIVRDERWGHIIHRWENRAALARGERLGPVAEPREPVTTLSHGDGGELQIRVPAETRDEWLYLSLEDAASRWRNFAWCVSFRCLSVFKELQFGFRYRDFYNRYRYRFQGGHVFFDVVRNGKFFAGLSASPFVIEPGRTYDLEIRVMESVFELWLDGRRVSVDYDPEDHFEEGSIAIILWEDDGATDMLAEIRSCSVWALERQE